MRVLLYCNYYCNVMVIVLLQFTLWTIYWIYVLWIIYIFKHAVRPCLHHAHPSVSFLHFPYIQTYAHFTCIQTIYIQPHSATMRASHASLRVVPSLSLDSNIHSLSVYSNNLHSIVQCEDACITRIPPCHSLTFLRFKDTLTFLIFKQHKIQIYSAKMRASHASLRVFPSLSSHMVPTRTLSTARYWILLNQNWNLWVWRAATKGLGARRRGTPHQNCCASTSRFKCMRKNILVHRMGSVCT